MGMLTKLTSLFSRSKPARSDDGPSRNPFLVPERPVAIDISDDKNGQTSATARDAREDDAILDADADLGESESSERRSRLPARRKQEVVDELRRSYDEVLELVRKVDSHLDQQQRRSERMMEIAERIPSALDSLPELVNQNRRMIEALASMVEVNQSGNRVAEAQTRELERVRAAVERSGEAERQIAGVIGEFRDAVEDVAGQNTRVGDTLEAIHRHEQQRDLNAALMLQRSQRWVVAGTIVCGAAVLFAVVVALVAIIMVQS